MLSRMLQDAPGMPACPQMLTWFPSISYWAIIQHITVTVVVRGLRNTAKPRFITKKPAYLPRRAVPPGIHVLAGCLQFTLTSWDKRNFESLGDNPGCLKDAVSDNNVVGIANVNSVFKRNQWGLVGRRRMDHSSQVLSFVFLN